MAIGVGALWLWAPGCSQPEAECTVGSASYSPYAAKYYLTAGDPESACGSLPGDLIGMQAFNPADGQVPDKTVKFLAIQAAMLGGTADHAVEGDPDEAHKLYSIGQFTSVEPDSGMCNVPTLSPAQLHLPEVPGEAGGGGGGGAPPLQVETNMTYAWSNVSVYVTTALLGNQAQGTLDITIDDCSATYTVVALWPAVGCEKMKFLAPVDPEGECDPINDPSTCKDCNPEVDENCNETGVGEAEPKLCDAEPDPEPVYNLPTGSGISPNLGVMCDPDLLLCVLNSRGVQQL
ncbi:MAG: hypothetical protein IT372_18345 [Polyangiaceae bacterium]|nr:hypothetical protein [Polyangiaceae bacterium]